jgi:hypothetical protein
MTSLGPPALGRPNSDFDRLGIVSNDGEALKSVMISTPGSESFKEFKQVQFSGTGIVFSIPQASTWAAMPLGLAGLACGFLELIAGIALRSLQGVVGPQRAS